MKGIILAAGSGTELRPLTNGISKPMIRILGKPILEYGIERMKANGIRDIFIVVRKDQIKLRGYFGDGKQLGVHITYVEQELKGITGAILSLKPYLNDDERFILSHGDIICHQDIISRTLNAAESIGTDFSIAITLESDIRDYGIVSLNSDGSIKRIHPEGEGSNYVIAGVFLFTSKIFEYLSEDLAFNKVFNKMIDDKEKIAAGLWNDPWFDIGRPWDILQASQYLLDKLDSTVISSGAYIESNVDIKGPVIIESGAEILNGTIIKGPVYISSGVFIGNNTLIRDHTEIGENVKIGFQTEIRSSIIMDNVSIAGQSYIGASIIGSGSTIHSSVITTNKHLPKKPTITYIGEDHIQEVEVPLDKFGAIIGPRTPIGVRSTLLPGVRVDASVIVPPNSTIEGHITL
ncbi:MAG: NTP transferase domain-containing protein [Candidatus Heimdallarchaeota archaeon]|nr:NTP transferase domain-containing protein [Candidatus Heimdallarchaeota archaeon]